MQVPVPQVRVMATRSEKELYVTVETRIVIAMTGDRAAVVILEGIAVAEMSCVAEQMIAENRGWA